MLIGKDTIRLPATPITITVADREPFHITRDDDDCDSDPSPDCAASASFLAPLTFRDRAPADVTLTTGTAPFAPGPISVRHGIHATTLEDVDVELLDPGLITLRWTPLRPPTPLRVVVEAHDRDTSHREHVTLRCIFEDTGFATVDSTIPLGATTDHTVILSRVFESRSRVVDGTQVEFFDIDQDVIHL